MQSDQIRTLLDLHGSIIDQSDGYWIKVEAWEVLASSEIPHGVRYSLTLHAPSGKRILGYDNAHAIKPKRKNFAGRRLPFDHVHRHVGDLGVPYEFKNAYELLSDFFKEVDSILMEVQSK